MTGRSVVVTGSAAGIGLATARAFALRGWQVVGLDIQQPTATVPDVAQERCDLSDSADVGRIIESLSARFPDLTALVNCAATQPTGPMSTASHEEWVRSMQVNVVSAVQLATGLTPVLSAGSAGAVVNVASVHAIATSPAIGVYAATKSALVSVTRTLAMELAGDGVRVNAVLPGAVDTDMLRDGLRRSGPDEEQALRELGDRTVMGRVGKPDEVANAIIFLADSDQSSYLTGSSLLVDGGASIRLSTE